MAKLSPFEFIGSLNDKKYMMVDQAIERQYNAFIVNRGLSQFIDAVPFVHFLNTHAFLDNKIQYDYLYHGLRKMKRFSKWAKNDKVDYLDDVIETYKVNRQQAVLIIERLSDDALYQIREKLNAVGGRGKLSALNTKH